MKYLVFIFILSLSYSPSFAQTVYERILQDIDQNNTSLRTLNTQIDALKVQNLTGIYLNNPEVAYSYLWGKPSDLGKQQDLSITQEFDIATLTGKRKTLANSQNKLVELDYNTQRIQILQTAKENIITVIYYNNLIAQLETQQQHAQEIFALYKKKLALGDATIIEFNRSKVNLANIQGQIAQIHTERERTLGDLKQQNGGVEVAILETEYPLEALPTHFETWYAEVIKRSPILQSLQQEIIVDDQHIAVQKSANLPTISAGFAREKIIDEDFKGVTLGVSIPLWQNKNKVKHARLAKIASEERLKDFQTQAYTQLQSLYQKANNDKKTMEIYRSSIDNSSTNRLLKKALDAGEITLLEYTVEQNIYYENYSKSVEAQQNYQLALAKLHEFLL